MRKRTPRRLVASAAPLSHHHHQTRKEPNISPKPFSATSNQSAGQGSAVCNPPYHRAPGTLERFWLDVIELFVIAPLSFIHARIWTLFVIESSLGLALG